MSSQYNLGWENLTKTLSYRLILRHKRSKTWWFCDGGLHTIREARKSAKRWQREPRVARVRIIRQENTERFVK